MIKTYNVYFLAVILTVILTSSCDDGKEAKPWNGKEIQKMSSGTIYQAYSGIPNGKTGEVYWFYFDAEKDIYYEIGMASYGMPPILSKDKNRAPVHAGIEMTAYKEDGTKIGVMNSHDEGNYLNTPINYYSPEKQKLYVSFYFLTDGYLVCRYHSKDL